MLNDYYEYKDYGKLKLICPGEYYNGQMALQLVKNGELYSTITVCLDIDICDDSIIIKDYSENEGMLDWCLKNNIVTSILRTVKQGFAEFPICKLNSKLYDEIHESRVEERL